MAPPKGWTRWVDDQFKKADFILLVCTETYRKRFEDEETPGVGRGVRDEAGKVFRELYRNGGENTRFLPVLFDANDAGFIPERLQDYSRYVLPEQWEDLLRRIQNRPQAGAPPVGTSSTLPNMKEKTASKAPPEQLRQHYLRVVQQRCGSLSMASLDPKATHESGQLQLHQIFTALDIQKPVRGTGIPARDFRNPQEKRGTGIPARDFHPEETDRREPALNAVSRESKLVLLGKPGAGKSTLVHWIGLCLAGELLGDQKINLSPLRQLGWTLPPLFPVPVTLRDYAARGLPEERSLWDFLREELKLIPASDGHLGSFAATLEKQLKEKGGILLLDGLDEVPEAHRRRQKLRKAVADFQAEFAQVRILVTTRPYAYADPEWQLPNFARADLLDFSPEQIEEYIDRWYQVTSLRDPNLSPAQAERFASQLKGEVKNNPSLAELAPRPLLLALMVSLHRWSGGGALPHEREKLYDRSVELLIDLWQRPKIVALAEGQESQELSALTELGIGPAELRAALSEAAFVAHRDQPDRSGAADIEGRVLAASIYPKCREGVDIHRVIRYCEQRAGLLQERGSDTQGQRIYAFAHRTFQEYLAACHLLDLDTFPDDLANAARQDPERWREAALLAAARTNNVSVVWELVEALCFKEVPDPGAAVEEKDWWGAFLAAAVLVETGRFETPAPRHAPKLEKVRGWLCRLLAESALTAPSRAEAGRFLAKLGDLRKEAMTLEGMRFCFVPAGPFYFGDDPGKNMADYSYWISEFPVTQAQFEVFVRDDGYLRGEFWQEAKVAGCWTEEGFKGRYEREARRGPMRFGGTFDLPNHPVVGVSWYEAVAFTEWLTVRWAAGARLPDGWRARLPTEKEWEKAARGGVKVADPVILGAPRVQTNAHLVPHSNPRWKYPWGDEFDKEKANSAESGVGTTSAVGCFPKGASPHGCQEMSGNVWEWVEDAAGGGRVVRGGGFDNDASRARVSDRVRWNPDVWYDDLGFRVVVAAAPECGG